jgi:hypothetical protein
MRDSLEYNIHDGAAGLRFELTGSLSGRGAESVDHAWNTALSVIGDCPLIIDITSVDQADDRGCALLQLWHKRGARVIANSCHVRALADAALGVNAPHAAIAPG